MRHLLQSHRCWSGVDERLCPFTHKAEIEVLDAALPRTFQVWSWGSSIVSDSLLHTSCDARGLRILAIFRSARKTDAVDWQRHVASIGRTRFDLKNNVGIFPGAGDFQGKVLREIRARHLMVPLLLDSSWEFDGTFVPSEAAGPLVFHDKRDA